MNCPLKDPQVAVIPLDFLTKASTNIHSGGQFLKNLEWFLDEYHKGNVVLASVRRQTCREFRLDLEAGLPEPLQSHQPHFTGQERLNKKGHNWKQIEDRD